MLICVQKVNFITQFFLNILQRNSKLVILGNLGMSGHTPKMIKAIWRNLWPLSVGKSSSSSFTFSLRYYKDIVNFFLGGGEGYFGHAWLLKPKEILSTCRKLLCSFAGKKSNSPPCFSGDTAKICKLFMLGTLGMPGCTHPKWWYQFVEDFNVHLHAKNKLIHLLLFWDITF